ncbi:MAG: arylsulfatase [Prolixibacteraceae bacterium]
MKKLILGAAGLMVLTANAGVKRQLPAVKPNIVLIYADDLGYGDIGVNGARGVQTPNIDRLAGHGVNFTDVHCTAATCTPSRYSLLTGSYPLGKAAVASGESPLIITPGQGTLASMLKRAGYATAVVGKWHLGLGSGKPDWNREIKPGPKEIGFDYSFLIPATGDRVPCVFLENQRVVGADPADPVKIDYKNRIGAYPVGLENPEMLKVQADPYHSKTIVNGVSRIGYMSGGKKALRKDEQFPFVLTGKAKTFMTRHRNQPFFLYFAFHDIHVPRVPNRKFVGKSTMGPRGDAIAQMDWCVGQLIRHLEKLGVAENTLVLFSSDNGPVLNDGYADQAVERLGDHRPAGPFRGSKYSIFEAGTRMPTIVYWPGTVKPGTCSALLSQVDLYASLANLAGQKVLPGEAPDSEDHLDTWLGRSGKGRNFLLERANTLALRMGDWKYMAPKSGGTPAWMQDKGVESGLSDRVQLYNLNEDIGETCNLAKEYPAIVREMAEKLNELLNRDRSVPQ